MTRVKKLAHGIGWGALSSIAVAGFQILFMGVMARLLVPADFGLVAVANLSLRVLSYFAQMGVSAAIVQKPEIEKEDTAAALFVSLLIALIATVAAILLAPLVSTFFEMPLLKGILRVISLTFLISGFAAISLGLLRRNLEYKYLAIIDALSYILGYGGVGISMAFMGYGLWALVGATLAQALFSCLLSYSKVRHSLSLLHSSPSRKHFISFGSKYSVIGFMEFASFNLDAILIGKILGEAASGLYNRALVIANLPIQQPATVITKALFPFLSTFSGEREKQQVAVQLSTLVIGGYAFAVSFGISAAAHDIVLVLLGDKWTSTIPILELFVLSIGPSFISHAVGVSLDSIGQLKIKMKIQLTSFVILCALMFFAVSNGILAITLSVVVSEWIRMLFYIYAVDKVYQVKRAEMGKIFIVLLTLAILAYGSVHLVTSSSMVMELPLIVRLICEILTGAFSLIFSFILVRKLIRSISVTGWVLNRVPRLSRLF